MAKKIFDTSNLRATVENQDALQDRFDKVDSILLRGPSTTTHEPLPPKSSVVRDTFSMPPSDYALIEKIRTAAAKEGTISTKSEVIRAGLHALDAFAGQELVCLLGQLEKMVPGRKY